MYQSRIEAPKPEFATNAAEQCGKLAIGCIDAAGRVELVAASVVRQTATIAELLAVVGSLEIDQRQVNGATDEARTLSDAARSRLNHGAQIVAASVADFNELTATIARLGTQLGNFSSAMNKVRETTQVIDAIARTTNMLALNAAIEAEKAGDAGQTFAVVAVEVKKLALDTRAATDEITSTMDSLSDEGQSFITEIKNSMTRSRAAEASFVRISGTVTDVIDIVDKVDEQTDDIARSTSLIYDSICRVGDELSGFASAAQSNSDRLHDTIAQMNVLESDANALLDTIVQGGFAPADRQLVDIAIANRDRIMAITEKALGDNSLSVVDLFDRDYRLISGSKPERYDARSNDFADTFWRPELDRFEQENENIVSNACTDVNGYLPTHMSAYSRSPIGDALYDSANCRHRRILFYQAELVAKASTKPFHMAVYRRENPDGSYHIVRNVYVPLFFAGQRWGDYELAYQLD